MWSSSTCGYTVLAKMHIYVKTTYRNYKSAIFSILYVGCHYAFCCDFFLEDNWEGRDASHILSKVILSIQPSDPYMAPSSPR
jgi:hypothetical protein